MNATPRLVALLRSLKARGLVFEYRSDADVTWTAHPFLRENFRDLLGCPAERVFDVVADPSAPAWRGARQTSRATRRRSTATNG